MYYNILYIHGMCLLLFIKNNNKHIPCIYIINIYIYIYIYIL